MSKTMPCRIAEKLLRSSSVSIVGLVASPSIPILWLLLFAATALSEPGGLNQADRIPAHDEYIYMIRFSADGTLMATAAGDNTAIVWDWKTRKKTHVLQHDSAVYAAVFHPTKSEVATANGDGEVSIWSTVDGKRLHTSRLHQDAVYCVDYFPDGKHLVSIGGHGKKGDTTCRIWKSSNLELIAEQIGHERPAYGVRVSPTGTQFATTGGDGLILLRSINDGLRRTLEGHTSDVYRCDFSTDGRWLASASQDHSVRIWTIHQNDSQQTNQATQNNEVLHVLDAGNDPTYDVRFSADDNYLVAVGDDGKARFWRTSNFELQQSHKLNREGLYAVCFTPQQTHIVAGGVDGKLYFHPVPSTEAEKSLDE